MSTIHDTLITSLRENSITKLQLSLDYRAEIPTLLDALRANTSVEEVNLELHDTFQQRDEADVVIEEVMEVMEALSALPNLTRLWMDSGRDEGMPFFVLSVWALVLVLQQAPKLQRLALYDVELHGHLGDWKALELAVRQHGNLHTFGLVGCRLAQETIELAASATSASQQLEQQDEERIPDEMLQEEEDVLAADINNESQNNNIVEPGCFVLSNLAGALAHVPTIQWVEWTGQESASLGQLSPAALGQLGQSPSLTKLTLESFGFKDAHISALAAALETSLTIQELKINCEISRVGCTALAQLLFVNKSLENFSLQLDDLLMDTIIVDTATAGEQADEEHNDNSNEEAHQIQGDDHAKHNNKNSAKDEAADPILLVAHALERNQTLEYFSLFGKATITKAGHEAFVTLLRNNMTLLHCEVDMAESTVVLSDELMAEGRLFLWLNELGRKELLQGDMSDNHNDNSHSSHHHHHHGDDFLLPEGNVNSEEDADHEKWIMTMWNVRHNLDGLFYLLSMNPTLCETAAAERRRSSSRRPTYAGLTHFQFKHFLS